MDQEASVSTWYELENGVFTGESLVTAVPPKSSNWVAGKRWMRGREIGRRPHDPEIETEIAGDVEMIDGVATRAFAYRPLPDETVRAVLVRRVEEKAAAAYVAAQMPTGYRVAVCEALLREALAFLARAPADQIHLRGFGAAHHEFPLLAAYRNDGADISATAANILIADLEARRHMAEIEKIRRAALQAIAAEADMRVAAKLVAGLVFGHGEIAYESGSPYHPGNSKQLSDGDDNER